MTPEAARHWLDFAAAARLSWVPRPFLPRPAPSGHSRRRVALLPGGDAARLICHYSRTSDEIGTSSCWMAVRRHAPWPAGIERQAPQDLGGGPRNLRRQDLTGRHGFVTYSFGRGAVAQLEEHLNGIQGVRGSNPLSSTKFWQRLSGVGNLQGVSPFCFGTDIYLLFTTK